MFSNEEATCKLKKIVELENRLNGDDLIYKIGNKKRIKKYDFQKFKTIRSFWRQIHNNDFSLVNALQLQIRWKDVIDIFK